MKTFTKKTENFVCENCGANVIGNGFTNHCPKCLWSRDVDINPGDRLSSCGGMMRPISFVVERDYFIITHQCEKCGKIRRQKSSGDDNYDALIKISSDPEFIFGK